MGLTINEFVMAVEEAFGISIPDEDLGIKTPRDLVEYLLTRLAPPHDPNLCGTQRAFLALRRAIMEVMRVPRARIRPEVQWNDLLPRLGRQRTWDAIRRYLVTQKLPSVLPPLGRGRLPRILIGGSMIAASGWLVRDGAELVLALVGSGLAGLCLLILTRPFKRPMCATIGDTAKYMFVHSQPQVHPAGPTWTREDISRIVLEIMAEQWERSDLTLDTSFGDLE